MHRTVHDPTDYLAADKIIDTAHPDVSVLAFNMRHERPPDVAFAAAAFEHVRDKIAHAWDIQDRRVTASASDTLR